MNSQYNHPDNWGKSELETEIASAVRLAASDAAETGDTRIIGQRVWISRDEVVVLVRASRNPSRNANGGDYDEYVCFTPVNCGILAYGDWSADWDYADWGGHSVLCASDIKSVEALYAEIEKVYEAAVKVCSTSEAAAALGISKRAVQRAIRVGTLAATRQGRDWFVSAAAIEDYRRDHLRRYGRKAK